MSDLSKRPTPWLQRMGNWASKLAIVIQNGIRWFSVSFEHGGYGKKCPGAGAGSVFYASRLGTKLRRSSTKFSRSRCDLSRDKGEEIVFRPAGDDELVATDTEDQPQLAKRVTIA